MHRFPVLSLQDSRPRVEELLSILARHGYILVFTVVFAEALGLPVPGAIALIMTGAAAASKTLTPLIVVLVASTAFLLGDSILYLLGRRMGWTLLGFLCRVAMNPEACILRAAESFYKRGKSTLIVAKFLPGVNTMASPLAGSMRMRYSQFLRFDLLGVFLYVTAYFSLGFAFHNFLVAIVHGFQLAGQAMEILLVLVIAGYIAYRVWLYVKHAAYRVVPRVQVAELMEKLASEQKNDILLIDVRSHGYYDPGAMRIQGSLRIEPNNLETELKQIPPSKDIYLYCTCTREATSARVAHMLRERGFNAFVVVGGLAAWRRAGLPLEPVPHDDVVKLPTFT